MLNVDSYGNHDPRKNGESADGIGIKEGSGTGNVVRGARLWNNVDDGIDLYEFTSPVTIENTYSWGNGFNRWGFSPFEGDGNGFKLVSSMLCERNSRIDVSNQGWRDYDLSESRRSKQHCLPQRSQWIHGQLTTRFVLPFFAGFLRLKLRSTLQEQ